MSAGKRGLTFAGIAALLGVVAAALVALVWPAWALPCGAGYFLAVFAVLCVMCGGRR